MAAMGHVHPGLALAIYAKVMQPKGGIGARIDTAMRDTKLHLDDDREDAEAG